jgi:hypothetical protein
MASTGGIAAPASAGSAAWAPPRPPPPPLPAALVWMRPPIRRFLHRIRPLGLGIRAPVLCRCCALQAIAVGSGPRVSQGLPDAEGSRSATSAGAAALAFHTGFVRPDAGAAGATDGGCSAGSGSENGPAPPAACDGRSGCAPPGSGAACAAEVPAARDHPTIAAPAAHNLGAGTDRRRHRHVGRWKRWLLALRLGHHLLGSGCHRHGLHGWHADAPAHTGVRHSVRDGRGCRHRLRRRRRLHGNHRIQVVARIKDLLAHPQRTQPSEMRNWSATT